MSKNEGYKNRGDKAVELALELESAAMRWLDANGVDDGSDKTGVAIMASMLMSLDIQRMSAITKEDVIFLARCSVHGAELIEESERHSDKIKKEDLS